MSDLKYRLESILFSAGTKISTEELSNLTKERDIERIKAALHELKKDLDEKGSSIMLVQEGDTWKMTVREKYLPFIRKVVTRTELPKSIIETLAIIAFKAPVMQSKVIHIRTNKAYRHLDQLEEMGYITREKKGRSKLIKLTPKFFEYFDVPPEKLKEKFSGFKELEKVIEQKEAQLPPEENAPEEKQEVDLVDEKGHKQKLAVYNSDKVEVVDTLEPEYPLEPAQEEMAGLEVYDRETKEKKHKKKKHKKKESGEEEITEEETEPSEETEELTEEERAEEASEEDAEEEASEEEAEPTEEPAEEQPEEITEEEPEEKAKKSKSKQKKKKAKEEKEEENLPEEEAEEEPEEERITEEKIKEEAKKAKTKPTKYESEGLFKGEIPTELEQKISKKAEEIVYGKKEEIEEEERPELEFDEKLGIEKEEKQEIDEENKPEIEEEEKKELPAPKRIGEEQEEEPEEETEEQPPEKEE